jgi:hypothetical protein
MRIKIFALVIAVVCVVVCAVMYMQQPGSEATPLEVRALNDLLAYVYQTENIYADTLWVLEAFKSFDKERSWESLQLARAALWIAKRDIEKLTLPKAEMTANDRAELISHGVDFSFMNGSDTLFRAEQISTLNIFSNLNNGIMNNVFLNESWANCMSNVQMLERLTERDIQYLANNVDWVLANINKESVREKFNAILEKHCPLIHAYQKKNQLSRDKIEADMDELLNQIEKLTVELTQVISAEHDRIHLIEDALAAKDLSLFADDIAAISGMPPVIAAPIWFNSKDIYYYWQENGNIVPSPAPRTKLPRVPDGYRVRISGVALDTVKAYQQELAAAGLTLMKTSTENEIACQYGDSVFAITWDNGTVTILAFEGPVCFVPRWYLPVLNSQKH